MNGPTAAVVIFFLLMCVKRLLLSLTPLLRYDTHTHTQLEIEKGKLVMSLYDKRDDFPFKVQNYPHLDSE